MNRSLEVFFPASVAEASTMLAEFGSAVYKIHLVGVLLARAINGQQGEQP